MNEYYRIYHLPSFKQFLFFDGFRSKPIKNEVLGAYSSLRLAKISIRFNFALKKQFVPSLRLRELLRV